jgi:hypothetical protein
VKRVTLPLLVSLVVPLAATDFSETEPNQTKAQALSNGAITLSVGDALVGTSTGSSTTTTGLATADTFLMKTASAALGIYQYRLVLTTAGTQGHVATVLGLSQNDGVIDPNADESVVTSTNSTSPPRFVQWYGFGKGEQLYYRVMGTAGTTSAYRSTLERQTIAPIDAGNFQVGNLTITTDFGGSTLDTDLWVYDDNLNPIAGCGNDDCATGSQSTLTRSFAAGTYYLAISEYNVCNNLASPADDAWRNGSVLDFPNAVACSSLSSPLTIGFRINDSSIHTFSATKTDPYQVIWVKFTVSGGSGPAIITHDNVGVLPSPGQSYSGSDANIDAVDSTYWALRPGIVFSSGTDPIALQLVAHAPGSAPSQLQLKVVSRASVGGIRQVIEAWDYTLATPAYVVLDTTAPLPFGGSADLVKLVSLDPSTAIKPSAGNEMKVRLRYRSTAIVFSFPWRPSIDAVQWLYTQ